MSSLKTRRRYQLCGSDYSAQEVRVFAAFCQDESMIKTYLEGKDLYAEVASMVYHVPYESCLEFNPITGEMQIDGKKRRTNSKSLVLGLMYGRGVKDIAEQIKSHDGEVTKEDIAEAKKLSESFFNSYPKARKWINSCYEDARKNGYVEDLWGRRRRLPDINLPRYEFSYKKTIKGKGKDTSLFNPLIFSDTITQKVSKELINKYTSLLEKSRSNDEREKIIKAAEVNDGILIKNNSGFIAQAERQSVNSRIQGSSATMTKIAMRNIYEDDVMRKLGFHLLIPVHDELIGECPLYNVEKCKARLSELMMEAPKPECSIPMKCDADDFSRWYLDVFSADIYEEFEKLIDSGKTKEEAIKLICEENSEFLPEEITEILSDLLT